MKQTEREKEFQKVQKQVTEKSTEGAYELQETDKERNMDSRDAKSYKNTKATVFAEKKQGNNGGGASGGTASCHYY